MKTAILQTEPSRRAPPVIGSNGVVYGTASIGGNGTAFDGFGVVFSLTPPDAVGGAWSEQTLYEFQGGNDGSYPTQLILTRNGVIYGIANDYSVGLYPGGSISSRWNRRVVPTLKSCRHHG